MVKSGVKIYVEGGGDSNGLKSDCRRGFSTFLEKAGCQGKMPSIVACGRRQEAYKKFCHALEKGEKAMLLVDSETAVTDQSPWRHLTQSKNDQWISPKNATDEDCHLMVECMENWFLADPDAFESYFGKDVNTSAFSKNNDIESISKREVQKILKHASKHTKKGEYDKGSHSFEILARIDPKKVMAASQWARRFVEQVKK